MQLGSIYRCTGQKESVNKHLVIEGTMRDVVNVLRQNPWISYHHFRCFPTERGNRAIWGSSSFTHGWRDRNFSSLLKDSWFQEDKYSSVTSVWAGNDLTSRYTTPGALTHAIEEVMAFGQCHGVPIRLVDVVGERYRYW